RLLREQTGVTGQLRALWALHVTGGLDDRLALELLNDREEWLRAWTIQLALEQAATEALPDSQATDARGAPSAAGRGVHTAPLSGGLRTARPASSSTGRLGAGSGSKLNAGLQKRLAALAATDPSPVVRLYLAAALQRLSLSERLPIAEKLVAHSEDADDANLPPMIWYGIEPIASTDDKASAA